MIVSHERVWCFRAVMFVVIAAASASVLAADKEEVIKADRALLAGEWRVVSVEANGNTNTDPVVARVTVVNRLDGTWSLLSNGKIIALKSSRGSVENARGTHYRGIYEVHETTRRLCFVPADKPLPESFAGGRETGQILVTFERVAFE